MGVIVFCNGCNKKMLQDLAEWEKEKFTFKDLEFCFCSSCTEKDAKEMREDHDTE